MYFYFQEIFGVLGETLEISFFSHTPPFILDYQNLLILSHLSESFELPAGC